MIHDLATHPRAYVTAQELAEYLVVSPKTVYYWLAKGAVGYVRLGRTVRIPITEARACVQLGNPVESKPSNPAKVPSTHPSPAC